MGPCWRSPKMHGQEVCGSSAPAFRSRACWSSTPASPRSWASSLATRSSTRSSAPNQMAADTPRAIPEGFVHVLRAPFINHVGPILQAVENPPGTMKLGLQVEQVHCNTMGFMHGGMIATVCDSAMARSTHASLQRRTVTLRMSLEYFDPIQKGDFI